MPKLPVVSGGELVAFMQSKGYRVVRQRGSHIRLELHNDRGIWAETVPDHKEIARGTLRSILRRMSDALSITIDELVRQLTARLGRRRYEHKTDQI